MRSLKLSLRLWLLANLVFSTVFITILFVLGNKNNELPFAILVIPASIIGSIPILIALMVLLPLIKRMRYFAYTRWHALLTLLLLTCLPYGIIGALLNLHEFATFDVVHAFAIVAAISGILFGCHLAAVALSIDQVNAWIKNGPMPLPKTITHFKQTTAKLVPVKTLFHHFKTSTSMNTPELNEQLETQAYEPEQTNSSYNKSLIKAVITAFLILGMLIPTAYIINLVEEREKRHKEVVQEVSSKWASAQTLTTPYLYIPYLKSVVNDTGKLVVVKKIWIAPASTLKVSSEMVPEVRKRSIYNVLLYRSNTAISGTIVLNNNKEIKPENMLLSEASLCIGISDVKGIEENISIQFDGKAYELEPGLPEYAINKKGLSVPLNLAIENISKPMPFSLDIKLKGSEQLHFLPLSDNSQFEIKSTWPDPSFDGSSLPKERTISDAGFTAKWSFNKANLPVLNQSYQADTNKENMAFGVTMVQTADQYAKTNRSVKYALLFISLTFAMFFIIELMQQRPVHPVQYILVGIALIIFYTLLLSIGEFIGFNYAYGIAATATVLLIGMYATSLFDSLKTSLLFSSFLAMLYGFIYVLIQLEDTALLAGSIGLFVLLAVAMHFSKKINWYGKPVTPKQVLA
ncbi:MAG: cell envelope integrity protein CreD [Bacteroidota bacterium]